MTTIRAKFRPARAVMERAAPAGPGQPSAPRRGARAERLARQLALAHLIERKIEAGEVRSYGEMARALGLTQPRVTQVMGLLALAPAIQERILLGGPGIRIRDLQRAARDAEWTAQGRWVAIRQTPPFWQIEATTTSTLEPDFALTFHIRGPNV